MRSRIEVPIPPIKFNTCAHRSEKEEERTMTSCCGASKESGFICNKLSIFKITPKICYFCSEYESKNIHTAQFAQELACLD
jgi:hypothetical protein